VKGIILAGGRATRLYPVTTVVTKQLLPVYDKPMIYYPLSVLMLAGIREVLLISTSEEIPRFQGLLGDGSRYGLQIAYEAQDTPRGIADAFLVGEQFIDQAPVTLILGDNIFFGHGLPEILRNSVSDVEHGGGAVVFGYHVQDPKRYGVVEFAADGSVLSLEEKPQDPKSNYAVTGLYVYDASVVEMAKSLRPSARGELEITDLNRLFLDRRRLRVQLLGRGFAWLDTGTFESLLESSQFVAAIERRQSQKVGCIEEIAFRQGYITGEQLMDLAEDLHASGYGGYLRQIGEEHDAV